MCRSRSCHLFSWRDLLCLLRLSSEETNPHMCRLRDLTYAAPIYVDVVYWKGDRKVRKRDLEIGMLPVMLRSNLCALSLAKTDEASWLRLIVDVSLNLKRVRRLVMERPSCIR